LWELPLAGGLLAQVPVGSGKTLVDLLAPMVVGARVAAVLVPPGLVDQLALEYEAVAEHFRVPSLVMPKGERGWDHLDGRPVLHVVPYSLLQREEAARWLSTLAPDWVFGDEVHQLKRLRSTRTGRVIRRCGEGSSFGGWSGTVASGSVLDFAHLSAAALGDKSPLPIEPQVAVEWASALDPSDWPAAPGALKKLCAPGESALEAVGRRCRETLGFVVVPTQEGVGASLRLVERDPGGVPGVIRDAVRGVRESWVRPDGEELADQLQVAQCVSALHSGFFHRWRFPGNPPRDLVDEWFAARRDWGREMRGRLEKPSEGLDSPKLLANAAERSATGYEGELPVWRSSTWARWRDVKDRVPHVKESVWVDDYLTLDAVEWARANRGIVWCGFPAFGERVAEVGKIPWHPGGQGADARIRVERGDRSIAASIGSHGEGRDGLQFAFSSQLVCQPMGSGRAWEQLLGRLHRRGQTADEVVTHVYRHVPEMRDSIDRAVLRAKFSEGLLTAEQRLLAADVEWELKR
jgi:hypothetical protein